MFTVKFRGGNYENIAQPSSWVN